MHRIMYLRLTIRLMYNIIIIYSRLYNNNNIELITDRPLSYDDDDGSDYWFLRDYGFFGRS